MIIDYKNYVAQVDMDEDGDLHGRVLNTRDVITFYGQTATELRQEFQRSIDDYVAYCKEQGREPEKPYSGQIPLRMPKWLHRALAAAAAREGKSVNKWVTERLERELQDV